MNFKIKFALTLFSVSLFFPSCTSEESADVSQDKIYADYELFYDKNEDKTYAIATFKFSNAFGTLLKLTAPSEVKFNSDIIPYDPIFSYYKKEYAGLLTSGTFTFKDKDGKIYTNTANMAKVIANPNITEINRAGAFTYTWSGEKIAANEWIDFVLINTANQLNFQYFLQNTLNADNLVLPVSQLNQLPIGEAFGRLDRVTEAAAVQATSAGGKVRGKYRTLNQNISIK